VIREVASVVQRPRGRLTAWQLAVALALAGAARAEPRMPEPAAASPVALLQARSHWIVTGSEALPFGPMPPADQPAVRSRWLYDMAQSAVRSMTRGDRETAARLLDASAEAARTEWTHEARVWWWHKLLLDHGIFGPQDTRPWTEEALSAALAPVLAHFGTRGSDGRLRNAEEHAIWQWVLPSTMLSSGDEPTRARGRAGQVALVNEWLDAAAQDPFPGSEPLQHLDAWARAMYGSPVDGELIDRMLQRMREVLGPGHLTTLRLMKSQVFRLRRLHRWAEALALTDEYARLVHAHQGGNPALLWSNVSERIGPLTHVGRLADALAEGQDMITWMASQPHTTRTNLMRVNTLMTHLALQMADADLAVRFGEAAVRYGGAIERGVDAPEERFAKLALHSARVYRGDPGAAQDLQDVLAYIGASIDIGHTDMLLWHGARSAGDTARQRWAEAFVTKIGAEANLGPPDARRARPALLQAMGQPAGTPDALPPAARAVAYGLVGRDQAFGIAAQFELARHVAPASPDGAAWLYKRASDELARWRQAAGEQASTALPGWLDAFTPALRAYVDLLIDQGRLAEVQQALEVLQGEELADFRRRSRGPRPVGPGRSGGAAGLSFTADEQARNAAIAPLAQALQVEARAVDRRQDEGVARYQRSDAQDTAFEALLARAAEETLAQATAVPPARPVQSARQARGTPAAALPPGTVRLTYWVQADQLVVLVQRGRDVHRVRVSVTAAELNRTVHAMRLALLRPEADARTPAQALHRWLILPVQPWLQGARVLRLVPDAGLRYLPFAALHDGRGFLVQRHALSVDLGGEPPAARPAPVPAKRLRAQGSPSSSLPLVAAFGRSLPDARHSALPGVAQEIGQLGALRGARVLPALDRDFTRETLRAHLARRPTVVHLASHFVLDPAGEEHSYLLLGDGSRLSLRQLRELAWPDVELALLSACESAVALEADRGGAEGRALFGFAQALRQAGVRQVMATLWRIDDEAAARWIAHFYAPWRQPAARAPLGPDWLAQAQRRWLQAHGSGPLAHPHYWAAFSWLGG